MKNIRLIYLIIFGVKKSCAFRKECANNEVGKFYFKFVYAINYFDYCYIWFKREEKCF